MTDKTTQEIHKIQVTKVVQVDYNLQAGWLAIVPAEANEEAIAGGICLNLNDLDALIITLGMVRERWEVAQIVTTNAPDEADWRLSNRLVKSGQDGQ